MVPEDYTLGNRRVWNSEFVHAWLLQRAVGHVKGTQIDDVLNKGDEEARYKHHQANNEELKEQKLRGELIPQAEVIHTLSSIISAARSKAPGHTEQGTGTVR